VIDLQETFARDRRARFSFAMLPCPSFRRRSVQAAPTIFRGGKIARGGVWFLPPTRWVPGRRPQFYRREMDGARVFQPAGLADRNVRPPFNQN